jgi:hypothetical protein
VRHEHNGLALVQEPFDGFDAALLEIGIPDGEDLVEEQDVGCKLRRDREPQSHVHAGREVLDWHVDEMFESRIVHDVAIDRFGFLTGQSVDGGIQEHILAAGQLRMKTDPQLDHGRDPGVPRDEQPSAAWSVDGGNQLQERALARSVAANQTHCLAACDPQRHVLQRPELFNRLPVFWAQQTQESYFQLDRRVVSQQELLGDALRLDHRCH